MSDHATATEPERPIGVEAPEPAPEPATESGAGGTALRVPGRQDLWFFLVAASVFALDQATKVGIRSWLDRGEAWPDRDWVLNIVNVSNSGAAFGILQGQTLFLVVMSLVGLGAILLYYFYPPLEHGLLRVGLALQLGGAAGNMIDRIRVGEVTDFINFDFWPAFNVADASISIGVVTIIWFLLVMEGERFFQPSDADGA